MPARGGAFIIVARLAATTATGYVRKFYFEWTPRSSFERCVYVGSRRDDYTAGEVVISAAGTYGPLFKIGLLNHCGARRRRFIMYLYDLAVSENHHMVTAVCRHHPEGQLLEFVELGGLLFGLARARVARFAVLLDGHLGGVVGDDLSHRDARVAFLPEVLIVAARFLSRP